MNCSAALSLISNSSPDYGIPFKNVLSGEMTGRLDTDHGSFYVESVFCKLDAFHERPHHNDEYNLRWTDDTFGAVPNLVVNPDDWNEAIRRVMILERDETRAIGWLEQFLPFVEDALQRAKHNS